MTLTTSEFGSFFAAVNKGHEPFPWQFRLLDVVRRRLESRDFVDQCFPELVDLPTGAGKTSLIDIAVFLLALEARRPLDQRRVPRRIVFVVDRRVIVDQAHNHASALAEALLAADAESVVGRVATALRSYSGGGREDESASAPLSATVLRGGIVRDESWARRPDLPAVISSTVDQVGSRVLFRGYGLSASMQPIHAGLLGSDTLFLLDEVHLSVPFAQTLRALADDYQTNWAERRVPARWEVVEMSATPGKHSDDAFRLDQKLGDLDPEINDVLPRRLSASKPATLADPVKAAGGDQAKIAGVFARACVTHAEALLERPGTSTVAVVVNRVETALAAYRHLRETGTDAVLLTGRMRPYDRDHLMIDVIGSRLETGRVRQPGQPDFVVVATQCIEAGADFDFDGLVTEAASLDSLIQRFGRVDRDGQLSNAGTPARSVIVVKSSDLGAAGDPVYGAALAQTWNEIWRIDRDLGDPLDFGMSGISRLLESPDAVDLCVVPANAPILFPGHLDAWVQTNPKPTPDPDPRFWLHGAEKSAADVNVVWRSGLSEGLLDGAVTDALSEDEDGPYLQAVRALVVAAPPGAMESMSVPLTAARKWLAGQEVPMISDVEADSPELEEIGAGRPPRPFVRWAGDGSTVVLLSDARRAAEGSGPAARRPQLRPGDVIVVPTEYGGVGDHCSWEPTSNVPVRDLAEVTQMIQRRRAVLRLWPGVLRGVDGQPLAVALPDRDEDPDVSDRDLIKAWLDDHLDELCVEQRVAARQIRTALSRGGSRGRLVAVEAVSVPAGVGIDLRYLIATGPVLQSSQEVARALNQPTFGDETAESVDSEPDTSSFTAVEVQLDDHLDGVGAWARVLATNCGLSADLVADLELAGRLHDLGKADPRFQVWLSNGDTVAASGRVLAKSATAADAYQLRRVARERSGYPEGARHEIMSLAMIDGVETIAAKAFDWDLVRHLVASHHGWCRPFAPAVVDRDDLVVRHSFDSLDLDGESQHRLARLDSGVADRFWILVRRYGWHRLAWFEAMLRLADHRRSEWEQRHPSGAVEADGVENGVQRSFQSVASAGGGPP